MWLTNRTEFSFRNAFGHIKTVVERNAKFGKTAGISDFNTFGFVRWSRACKEANIKPIFGVQIPVVISLEKSKRGHRNIMSLIAMNKNGLSELFELVKLSTEQFYYAPRISYKQVSQTSKNIILLSGVAPKLNQINREFYLQLSPETTRAMSGIKSIEAVACCNNFYPRKKDSKIYEAIADKHSLERRTSPQYILSPKEWLTLYPGREDAILNLEKISKKANATLPKAPMIKYPGKRNIERRCYKGAKKRGLSPLNKVYQKRLRYELDLILEKNYVDYFLIVADIVERAKKKMMVGPTRGSAGGSLVCYLLGITEIDPIKHNLYFERFIDVNRLDLPDIDIDFQDDKRDSVILDIEREYQKENVAQIGNISTLKEKSGIARIAKSLKINESEIEALKEAATVSKEDLKTIITETDLGKAFLKKYPEMNVLGKVENHALHSSTHAAGVLICNKKVTNYCGINTRTSHNIGMLDKDDAEELNLLKVDILGLRTLTIIASVCDNVNLDPNKLYSLPLDNKKVYKALNKGLFSGIFQFEGNAIRRLASSMPIKNIDDISALSAICRPGSLVSGSAARFARRRSGKENVSYLDNHKAIVKATKETYGTIIYQEQVMEIARNYAGMNWEEVGKLRKAVAKSKGKAEMNKFKKSFIKGATKNGAKKKVALQVWENILTFGGYGFNKAHSMGYAYITYLTAYMKVHFPEEFTIAVMDNISNDHSALKFLREMVEFFDMEYVFFDKDISENTWTVHDGCLYGGFLTLKNVGEVRARKFMNARQRGTELTSSERSIIKKADSPFRYLYPAKELYGKYYKRESLSFNRATEIKNLKADGTEYTVIGLLMKKNIRDMNEVERVMKRGGTFKKPPTTFLTFVLEDDTGSILATIWADDFEASGKQIADNGKEETDWYILQGTYNKEWNSISTNLIRKITRG